MKPTGEIQSHIIKICHDNDVAMSVVNGGDGRIKLDYRAHLS